MYAYIKADEVIGIQGIAVYKNEAVIAYIAAPEGLKSLTKKRLSEAGRITIREESVEVARVGFSMTFLFKEKKHTKPFDCHQMVFVNHRATLQSPDIKRQFFFIPKDIKTEEAILKNLKEQFFSKALSKLPIPIHDNWKEYVWDGISNYFEEVELFGSLPYSKIYALEIPVLGKLSNLVEISHKSFEFKSKFKRIPKLKAVLAVSDVQNFDFKDLQKFLNEIGGPDTIEEFLPHKQDALMKAYEVLKSKNTDEVMKNADFWYMTAIKKIGVMIRNTQNKGEKERIRQMFLKGWKYFNSLDRSNSENDYRRAYIGNFHRVYEEKIAALKNNDFKPIIKMLNEISYDDVAKGAEEMAKVCSKAKLSPEEYRQHEDYYLSELPKIQKAHKEFPTISNQFNKDYFWEIIDMGKPRAWMVGYETNCCQHLGSIGGACVEYAAKNPSTSGILRITKKGKVVAQSFIWLSDFKNSGNRVLVFDNIETLREEVDDSIFHIYKEVSDHIERYAELFRIENITIGAGYLDVDLKSLKKLKKEDKEFGRIPSSLSYTDAGRFQFLLREYKFKERRELHFI